MVTALYRRYRPETFAEMIGQAQVTEPLMTALRTNRVNHAYLFSGPRGCGKTTSARILARCLNCVEGPTDTPCGVCESCVELGRGGQGSLDVVEIDAASHNGVDDARDIRERAIFAPARDRYKIFILDEAHMVTPQGFNALLKIVEEPPEHVKFIFATTEPEKVIGTIRSRTHHYPFRLVPPALMLDYVQKLCSEECIAAAPGVLPLVVRAGGGSPRDTLSLLDQLMAGSEGDVIDYERAVALLGYTHAALLDEVVDALAGRDAAAAFAAVDRVVQTGQDPRRFVEDLLERLRDLIVIAAAGRESAAAVLRGVPADELDRMATQARSFGSGELSRVADIVFAALTEMSGTTAPRLQLELMLARALVERDAAVHSGPGAVIPAAPAASGPAIPAVAAAPAAAVSPAAPAPAPVPAPAPAGEWTTPGVTGVAETAVSAPTPAGPVTLQQLKDAWPQVLDRVQKARRAAWLVVFTATVRKLDGDVLTLTFPSDAERDSFRPVPGQADGASELLRQAILDLLGIRVKFVALTAAAFAASLKEQFASAAPAAPSAAAEPAPVAQEPAPVAQEPALAAAEPAPAAAPAAAPAPAPA
ncbi:DNA polymerase III subunit gamma and tau, partial [Gryllotalpicola sp.]|uniref:DNA polymerase III subunit gamma and tau n=1 Tax=Gryllotalpicola sp. TaxID=1932787 RepID=UPI002604278F